MSRKPRVALHPSLLHLPPRLELHVVRGPWGQLRVVDSNGVPLLSHPDPLEAVRRAYLARACDDLRRAVAPLVWRLQRIEVDHGIQVMARDDRKIAEAWLTLHEASPPVSEITAALDQQHQQEIHFEDEAA